MDLTHAEISRFTVRARPGTEIAGELRAHGLTISGNPIGTERDAGFVTTLAISLTPADCRRARRVIELTCGSASPPSRWPLAGDLRVSSSRPLDLDYGFGPLSTLTLFGGAAFPRFTSTGGPGHLSVVCEGGGAMTLEAHDASETLEDSCSPELASKRDSRRVDVSVPAPLSIQMLDARDLFLDGQGSPQIIARGGDLTVDDQPFVLFAGARPAQTPLSRRPMDPCSYGPAGPTGMRKHWTYRPGISAAFA